MEKEALSDVMFGNKYGVKFFLNFVFVVFLHAPNIGL